MCPYIYRGAAIILHRFSKACRVRYELKNITPQEAVYCFCNGFRESLQTVIIFKIKSKVKTRLRKETKKDASQETRRKDNEFNRLATKILRKEISIVRRFVKPRSDFFPEIYCTPIHFINV